MFSGHIDIKLGALTHKLVKDANKTRNFAKLEAKMIAAQKAAVKSPAAAAERHAEKERADSKRMLAELREAEKRGSAPTIDIKATIANLAKAKSLPGDSR